MRAMLEKNWENLRKSLNKDLHSRTTKECFKESRRHKKMIDFKITIIIAFVIFMVGFILFGISKAKALKKRIFGAMLCFY